MDQHLIEFSAEWLTIAQDDLKWAKDTYADGHREEFAREAIAEAEEVLMFVKKKITT